MGDRETIARLARRVGFGLAPGELDDLEALGVDGTIDRLVDPDDVGVAAAPVDLWEGMTLHSPEPVERRDQAIAAIDRWLDAMVDPIRPLEEWMAWFWHGHLVSSILEVPYPILMARQTNLFRREGLGAFPALLRSTTLDAAMLLYLDGAGSSAEAPNENYGREMLELFALGIGNYAEADVQAAAGALTGYRISRATGEPYFVPRAHDPTGRRLLGVDGVSGVEAVVDAVVSHDACPTFVTRSLAEALLGPELPDDLVDALGRDFRTSGLELRPLVRALLEAGADGRWTPIVSGPVAWLAAAQRATGASLEPRDRLRALVGAGQVPWVPPNVGGWAGHTAWLTSATTVARANLATAVARATPGEAPLRQAAVAGDVDLLADGLGRPEGFGAVTRSALGSAARSGGRPGDAVLAVALCSPEMVVL